MHILLARLEGKNLAVAIVDGVPEMVNMRDWSGFCRDHRGATLFGCDVSFKYQPEDIDPEGQFSLREDVEWVKNQIRAGNEWAWFCAIATAKRGDYTATDSLGGCSYASEADWLDGGGGYFGDMVRTVAEQVQAQFVAALGTFETI